jgi:GAF domain-containing protein
MGRGSSGGSAEAQAKRPVAGRTRKADDADVSALRERLAQASEQREAIGDILSVMSGSPGDVRPVLDAVAERAARLCEAPFARVSLVDGDALRIGAEYSIDGKPQARTVPLPLKRSSIAGRAVLDHRPVHHADVVPLLETEYPEAVNARALGLRAVLAVPLIRDDDAYGAIVLFRREPRAFSPEQIALVETFARQAAIAIDHARLFTQTKEALEQQTATSEILRVISQSPTDVQPVFDTIASSALKLCGAGIACVFTYDGHLIHLAADANLILDGANAWRKAWPRPPSRETASARAILTSSVVVIPDVLEDAEYTVSAEALGTGFRSAVSVPLMRDGTPIGVIGIGRAEPGHFPDTQISLLKTFADQAVIAIENVRLFNETKEALERQTATSEILRVISRSPTDVQPVFDTIADAALNLCKAANAIVFTFDGELIRLAAIASTAPEGADAMRKVFPRPPSRETAAARAVLTRSLVVIPDVMEDPEFSIRSTAAATGFRSIVSIPLMREGDPIGVIGVGRSEPGPFPDKQIELLKTFADQAVIAIENVRLFKELEARTGELTRSVQELKALGEVGQAVSSTLDLETVLSTIVSRAAQLAGMDAGAIYEYDEGRGEFYLHTADRLQDEVVTALRAGPIRKGEGALGRMAVTGEPAQIRDIMTDANYQRRLREIVLRLGYRSLMALPLMRDDHLLGGLVVYRKTTGEFDSSVIDLLRTFATQSALAIQNARLYREIEVKSRELESASRHKSEFLANMSHELRTPLNAIIGFSEVLYERMFGEINEKQAEYISDILQSGHHLLSLINDILDLSKIEAGRMELDTSDFDLPGTIENTLTLVRERALRRGIALGCMVDERLGTIRADERKVKQVLLNLLSNALKFTPEGGKIDVRAAVKDGEAEISVTDTGVGIAPEEQQAVFEEFRQVGTASKKVEGTGLGLAISRKFIELHGGRIWVESTVGSGSTFAFTLPLR